MEEMVEVVIHGYVRASTDDQTTEQQKMAITKAYPEGRQFVWYEENESGWHGKRSEYDALKDAILKGRCKEICACNVARLGRNQREVITLLMLCHDRGVKIKIIDTDIDFSGPLGSALFALFAAFAQIDSDTKSANIRRKFALKRLKDKDWKMHGNVKDTVSKHVKGKAPEVYRMTDDGKPIRYIAEMLGLSTSTVQKVLRLRGRELLTRLEYAKMFPDWHLKPIDKRPAIPVIAKKN